MRCDGLTNLQIKDCSINISWRSRLENSTGTYNYAVSPSGAALELSRLTRLDVTLRLLNYRASQMLHDLASTINDGLAEGLDCRQRAAWILQSPTTARWLDNAKSSMLLHQWWRGKPRTQLGSLFLHEQAYSRTRFCEGNHCTVLVLPLTTEHFCIWDFEASCLSTTRKVWRTRDSR